MGLVTRRPHHHIANPYTTPPQPMKPTYLLIKPSIAYSCNRVSVKNIAHLYTCLNQHEYNIKSILSPVLFHDFDLLKNILSFLVLLGLFKSFLIFPSQHFLTLVATYVSNCMQARPQLSIFFDPNCHIHDIRE